MNTTATTHQSVPIRGAIRAILDNSTDAVVAGANYSIFVRIQNPFEVPIKLRSISTHIPTEFVDLDRLKSERGVETIRQSLAELYESAGKLGIDVPLDAIVNKRKPRFGLSSIKLSLPIMSLEFRQGGGTAIARDMGESQKDLYAELSLPFIATTKMKQFRKKPVSAEQKEEVRQIIQQRIEQHLKALESAKTEDQESRELQPGNSTTRVFTLRTQNKLLFRPATYRLLIEVEYEIEGTIHTDSIEHTIQVSASLSSVVAGSILGSIGGWVVRTGAQDLLQLSSVMNLAVSIVLGMMSVVLFARKKDAQPMFSIQDFWGGIAVGFAAAYVGPALIDNLLPEQMAGGGATMPPGN